MGQSKVGEGLLVGDALRVTAECSFDWKELGACLVLGGGRFHCCAGYGRPAVCRKVPNGQSMELQL